MNCRDCGFRTDVVKTQCDPKTGSTQRLRECRCGSRGWTEERVVKWLPVTTGNLPVTAGNLPVTAGGLGGSSLDSAPNSLRRLGANPEPSSVEREQETPRKKRGRGDAADYGAAFEIFWSNCANGGRGKGNKYPASKAFAKFNRDPILTATAWNRWMSTPAWQSGYNKDVSTWLNARGWQDEPTEAEMRPRSSAAEDRLVASRSVWDEVVPSLKRAVGK